MIPIYKIIGRLSNQMFEFAALYAWTKDRDIPFFVQDEKYFKKYEDDIRSFFGHGISPNSIDKVAIHVRLTDYVGNAFYVDLGHHEHGKIQDNYYVKAMELFPNDSFIIFSDDIKSAKTMPMFQGDRFTFSEGNDEISDMNLMANCKSHIIANSSFSWWAAWLGKHPDQKVIAPKQWFSDHENEKFIGIPDSWVRI